MSVGRKQLRLTQTKLKLHQVQQPESKVLQNSLTGILYEISGCVLFAQIVLVCLSMLAFEVTFSTTDIFLKAVVGLLN